MAAATAALVQATRLDAFPEAYTLGLLHNFGDLVLAHVHPGHMTKLFLDLRNRTLGKRGYRLNTFEIAASVLEYWRLPTIYPECLRNLNNPEYQGKYRVYLELIWVAIEWHDENFPPMSHFKLGDVLFSVEPFLSDKIRQEVVRLEPLCATIAYFTQASSG